MKTKVHNGTAADGLDLCRNCTRSLRIKGHRESEEVRLCRAVEPNARIDFPVAKCSSFDETDMYTQFGTALYLNFDRGADTLMVAPNQWAEAHPMQTFLAGEHRKKRTKGALGPLPKVAEG